MGGRRFSVIRFLLFASYGVALFTACGGGGGGGLPPIQPDTFITSWEPNKTVFNGGVVTIHFSSDQTGATFECQMDSSTFTSCPSSYTLSLTPLSDGSHTFRVRAVLNGQRDATPASFNFTVDRVPPGAPTAISSTPGDGRITLAFSAPSDPDLKSYRIYRSPTPISDISTCNCFLESIPASTNPMQYSSKNLTPNNTYYHRITAVDEAGNEGLASDSLSGTPLSEILITNVARFPHSANSAFDGSRFLVVWDDDLNNNPLNPNYDISGVFVHPDGYLPSLPFTIYQGPGNQQNPRVAFDAGRNHYVVVWEDTRSGTPAIYAARITPDGTVLDPSGQMIASSADNHHNPVIACGFAGCLVAWEKVTPTSRSILYSRFVDSPQDMPPVSVYEVPPGDIPLRISVTASPSLFLITWSSAADEDPFAVRVSWAGIQDPTPVRLTAAGGNQTRPIATPLDPDDSNPSFLIVWEDYSSGEPNRNDIKGAVLPPTGSPSSEIGISVGSPGKKELTTISASPSGLRGMIAWADNRDGITRIYFLMLRLTPIPAPDGAEAPASGSSSYSQSRPGISFGFGRFLLSWLDFRRTVNEENPIIDVYAHALDE